MKEYIIIISIVLVFSLCLTVGIDKTKENIISAVSHNQSQPSSAVIILDAGHGGEDSGAVAEPDIYEKDINLIITNCISLYFDIFGIDYILIRSDDSSVGDTSLPTIRERKVSDIRKRYDIINSFPNSVLLSIHQNYFPVQKYNGTQVFFAPDDEKSEILAGIIQSEIKNSLQPDNNRKIKKSDNSIFLLNKAKRPSVLVECGFMSNKNELELLQTTEYQSKISYFITTSVLNYLLST